MLPKACEIFRLTVFFVVCLGGHLSALKLIAASSGDPVALVSNRAEQVRAGQAGEGVKSVFSERGQRLHERELRWILWLQQTKVLEWPMLIITNTGPSAYVIVLLPFVFLCVDPRIGARLAIIYFVTSGIREALAMTLCFPRPYWIDSRIDTFQGGRAASLSYSFPSGHATVGTSIWLFAASRLHRPWAWGAGLAIALLICFSRVYLGVHWPSDVAAGFIGGAVFVAVFLWWESSITRWWRSSSLVSQCAVSAALAGALVSIGILAQTVNSTMPDQPSWAAMAVKARELSRVTEQAGAVLGLGLGLAMGRCFAAFEVRGAWWQRLICWFLGCSPLAAIYLGRKLGPADSEMIRAAVRFASALLATWLMTFVVPWLCLRWKLVKPASH